MPRRYETTDGRYVKIAEGEWWDKTGTDIVREAIVDEHMRRNRVGIVVLGDADEETTDDLGTEGPLAPQLKPLSRNPLSGRGL